MDEVPFSQPFDSREGPQPLYDEGGMAPDALGRDAMRELTVPVRHEWLTREPAYGKIAIEPFESGFALTVGNAYRRVLLSSISGAAPTWAKIEGALHEFSYRPGVMEDTLDVHPYPAVEGPPTRAARGSRGRASSGFRSPRRTRGSSTAYARSTSTLTTTTLVAKTTTSAWT